MDRNNFGHGQVVTEGEFDGALDHPEQAERDMAIDTGMAQAAASGTPSPVVYGGISWGLEIRKSASNDYVLVSAGAAHDNQGRRCAVDASGTVKFTYTGDTDAGDVDNPEGDGASIVSSCPAGSRIVVSVFIAYDEIQSDERTDAAEAPYYFDEEESFHFNLDIGTSFTDPPSSPPSRAALQDGKVLLADVIVQNVAGELSAVAVCNSSEDWDDLGGQYANCEGRRADCCALDNASDFALSGAAGTGVRGGTFREALFSLFELLQETTAPAGSQSIGARAQTGAALAYAGATAQSVTAASLDAQIKQLLDILGTVLYRGGNNQIKTQSGIQGGLTFEGGDMNDGSYHMAVQTNIASAGTRMQKIHAMKYGHIARAHEFFDDFMYAPDDANHLMPTGNGPWGQDATDSGNTAKMVTNLPGGVVKLETSTDNLDYICLMTGYNKTATTFVGWWAPLEIERCIAMFRFKLGTLTNVRIELGLFDANPVPQGGGAMYIRLDTSVSSYLQAVARASDSSEGTPVTLDSSPNSTFWYTYRIVVSANDEFLIQGSSGNYQTVSCPVGKAFSGAYYGLGILVRNLATSACSLQVDQAFAAGGGLHSDMGLNLS